ncbi:septum site-determining protein MinC [Romboutsia maritimum]|uniref:Probable septum site-determining protein MinC n=1 Tax=Romboutsia maritimum TaxID=2020948 RepID=A0A371IU80_9FIRM|nr:septum site-determining protein MinC [Romboutsia maritimum]RDY24040.1 septum site-determining protein MinC [Romboutsia maritimum]
MSLKEFTAEELVEFKGSKRGLIVNIKRVASFDEIKESLIDRLETSIGFFNGAKICAINCNCLSDIQIIQIKDDIVSRFDVEFIEEEIKREVDNFRTKYINNLRSGENVEFDGDIIVMTDMKPGSQVNSTLNTVVMGDISSGARVVAGGNVTVMGSVKGFIHAGANGNDKAYVVANHLSPKVLQISENIAEAPDDDEDEQSYDEDKEVMPEIAFVSKGRIIIESYLPKIIK